MGRRGVKGPEAQEESYEHSEPVMRFKGPPAPRPAAIARHRFRQNNWDGLWLNKRLKQWLWFHGDDTVLLYLSCSFGALYTPCRAVYEKDVSQQTHAVLLWVVRERQSSRREFCGVHPCLSSVRDWEAWNWDIDKYTYWYSLSARYYYKGLPCSIPGIGKLRPQDLSTQGLILYSLRAKNVHIFKRLYIKKGKKSIKQVQEYATEIYAA